MACTVRTCCSILFLISFLLSPTLQQSSDPLIVMGPVDSTTAVGEDAVFYCKVRSGASTQVYWVVNRTIGLGPNGNTNPAYDRYEIFSDNAQGYYNLRIKDVTAADAVQYDCVVDIPNSSANEEAGAQLSVLDSVQEPTTSSSDLCIDRTTSQPSLSEGDFLNNFRCRSRDGVPVGELQWNILRADDTVADIPYDVQVDGDTITATSSSYQVTAADHDSVLACTLSHPSLTEDQQCFYPTTGRLLVKHAPVIEFGPEIEVYYLQSKTFQMTCTASAYPSNVWMSISFSNPERSVTVTREENGVIEALIEISQSSDIGKYVNCTASNEEGESTSTIEVELRPWLPSWLLITVLIIAVVILFVLALCCCCFCCHGCQPSKKEEDQTDLAHSKAAGYDVNDSRPGSLHKPNGLVDDQPAFDDSSFTEIPLNDYSDYPPPSSAPNDHETGEVNDGYMTPDAQEPFPPMIEDEHLMGEKTLSTFKPADDELPPPPAEVPPPPPLDFEPTPIPSIELE